MRPSIRRHSHFSRPRRRSVILPTFVSTVVMTMVLTVVSIAAACVGVVVALGAIVVVLS